MPSVSVFLTEGGRSDFDECMRVNDAEECDEK